MNDLTQRQGELRVKLPTLHPGQIRAFWANTPSERQLQLDPAFSSARGRYKAVRCGRRWGKTDFLKTWVGDGALKGFPCGIFAPDYKRMIEVYNELTVMLAPVIPSRGGSSKTDGVIRLITGGRIDFWTLQDENAGRSRKYKRVALDEAAFTGPNMMDIWRKSIQPTLLDLRGSCIAASNTNGIDPENFLWQVCNKADHQFIEVHEPSWNNPHVPGPVPGMTEEENWRIRMAHYADLKARTPPLVYEQEYASGFVDWSGVAFFGLDKMLVDGSPVALPTKCDRVFAVIDSAVKTGSDNDGTAVVYFARNQFHGHPLILLDWEIVQIEADLLNNWVPNTVFRRLEELSRACGARQGVAGTWVEDKQSGQALIQHAKARGWNVKAIDSAFTAIGKDERAIAVSSHHYQGKCKISGPAYDKTTIYKSTSRNHLIGQVAGFRIGDKLSARRADDLLDCYVYGLALGLGGANGF